MRGTVAEEVGQVLQLLRTVIRRTALDWKNQLCPHHGEVWYDDDGDGNGDEAEDEDEDEDDYGDDLAGEVALVASSLLHKSLQGLVERSFLP